MRSSSSKPLRCWRARTDRIRRCRGGWHAKGVRSQHMAPAHLGKDVVPSDSCIFSVLRQ
jgi:hypothetical protein